MDTSEFGFWAMIIFWGTALGGIATAIVWARMRGTNPVDRELLVKSLQKRLQAGEISQQEYEKKLAELPGAGNRE
jgi:putative membrane protein